jgi:WD40 repeat protein
VERLTERTIPSLVLSGHWDAVWQCAFSPDGTRILSASRDNTLKLWDGVTGNLQANLTGHRGWVRDCAFAPDGARIVSGSRDRTLKLWDPASGAELATLKGHADEVNRVAFCLGGARIVSGSLDGSVRLWDVASGQMSVTRDGPLERVTVLAASKDGKRVAAGQAQWVTIWDAETGAREATLDHDDLVRALTFSPEGDQVLTGAGRGALKLWDAKTGQQLAAFVGHANYISACAFSPDGKRFASASRDETIRVWDPATGQLTALLTGHTAEVSRLAFSPDGKFLVSASGDKTLRWWNALTGAALATLSGHTDEIHACAFAPDGTRIVSASHDKTLRLWLLQPLLREPEVQARYTPRAATGKLFAFLSYRRESGADTARLIRAELLSRGLKSFLDVDDLGAYHFDESLLKRIEEAAHFILVLSPGALDRCANEGDWLRREIAHAISSQRNVVPVLKEGFHFPPREALPAELADLPRYNCVDYSHIYFQATMGRLLSFCGMTGNS